MSSLGHSSSTQPVRHRRSRPISRIAAVILIAVMPGVVYAGAANFLFGVRVPPGGATLGRPAGMFYDRRSQELLVTDAVNDRVVIFDRAGNYQFEFTDRHRLSGPEQLIADSLGRIFVLSSGNRTRLSIFDYNGVFLFNLELVDPRSHKALEMVSIAIDDQDQIVAMGLDPAAAYLFTTDGRHVRDFPLFTELDKVSRTQQVVGNISLVYGELMIPMPILGQVARYKLDGEFAGLFGHLGSTSGGLGFPIAVGSDGQGGYLVLDKNRHSMMQFSRDGKFIREYGGLGMSPGWFYHPGFLTTGPDREIFVSQSYMSRVQALRVEPTPMETNPAMITASGKEGVGTATSDQQSR